MEIKTYRAATMHAALVMVRQELGPDAAVLHTREVRTSRLFGLIAGPRQIEVTASAGVNVPSRLPAVKPFPPAWPPGPAGESLSAPAGTPGLGIVASAPASTPGSGVARPTAPGDVQGQLSDLRSMVQDLCRRTRSLSPHDLPESLFRVFTELIDADVGEDLARELVERVRSEAQGGELSDPVMLKARIARLIEGEIHVAGPIVVTPGQRRLAALVGPTGVGKTTTIAKLAAVYRLREKRSVGLITVDTYRIAAVEQLRTYADIIDLPMQVVSTPREMREAVRRMEGLDLILLDTAGRSPRDEIKIQELRSFLTEAAADDVYLVLSSVAGVKTLKQVVERFATVGTTSLILTKLDESTGLGHLLPVLRDSHLPLSYLTNGQNVPDDIEVADPARLARLVLEMDNSYSSRSA
jgi:flagellar biosynthesis protein FlhF